MLHFKIATPERIMLETDVNSLTLPTALGEITVLPGHIPLVSNLVAGEIRYKAGGKESFFAVSGGVIEVRKNGEVVILADSAEFGHEIDVKRAEEARERAHQLMSQTRKDEKTFADASAVLQKNLARIKVAKKHHTHNRPHMEQ